MGQVYYGLGLETGFRSLFMWHFVCHARMPVIAGISTDAVDANVHCRKMGLAVFVHISGVRADRHTRLG